MMKRFLLYMLMIAGTCSWVQGQEREVNNSFFDANCLNILSPKGNSLIEINFNPPLFHIEMGSGNAVANLEIVISVHRRGQRNYLLEKHFKERIEHRFLSDENVFFRRYSLKLPEGSYLVEMEVRDLETGKFHFSTLDYECKDLTKGYQFSDIVLEQQFLGALGAQTLLTGRISPHPGNLNFFLEVYGPAGPALTARAVLYRKSGSGLNGVNRFASVKQMISILKPNGSPLRFSDTIALNTLESGEYLLEVYLERDNQLLAEESRAFTVSWKKEGRIFGDLDNSIQMLGVIASRKEIGSILGAPSEEEKIERFQQYWEKRSREQAAGVSLTREAFYERAFHAEDHFAEDSLPGWKTARGRTYIIYGAPAEIKPIQKEHLIGEIWDYQSPPLRFVFREADSHWELIKP